MTTTATSARREQSVVTAARVAAMVNRSQRAREASRFLGADDHLSRAATVVAQAARSTDADGCSTLAQADKALRLLGFTVPEFRLDLQRVLGDSALQQALLAYLTYSEARLER